MASRVYLHIGASKSGTTYLQGRLAANHKRLVRHGTLFPMPADDHYRLMLGALERLHDPPRPPIAHSALDRLTRQARDWDGQVLVSNELIAAASEDQAVRLVERFAPAEVHVVYTVRDLARTLPSEWQQAVKGGLAMPLSTYADQIMETWDDPLRSMPDVIGPVEPVAKFRALHNMLDLLPRWSAAVPQERIHVVTVPPQGADRHLLWKRFSAAVGVDPASCPNLPRIANESVGAVEIELLRRVNHVLDALGGHDFGQRNFVRLRFVRPVLMRRTPEAKIAIRPSDHSWARRQADHLVDHLDGYHVIGDADDLIPADTPASGQHPDDSDDDLLNGAAVEMIAEMLQRQHRDRAR